MKQAVKYLFLISVLWTLFHGVCPYCWGKDYSRLFASDINKTHDYFAAKGSAGYQALHQDYGKSGNQTDEKQYDPGGRHQQGKKSNSI